MSKRVISFSILFLCIFTTYCSERSIKRCRLDKQKSYRSDIFLIVDRMIDDSRKRISNCDSQIRKFSREIIKEITLGLEKKEAEDIILEVAMYLNSPKKRVLNRLVSMFLFFELIERDQGIVEAIAGVIRGMKNDKSDNVSCVAAKSLGALISKKYGIAESIEACRQMVIKPGPKNYYRISNVVDILIALLAKDYAIDDSFESVKILSEDGSCSLAIEFKIFSLIEKLPFDEYDDKSLHELIVILAEKESFYISFPWNRTLFRNIIEKDASLRSMPDSAGWDC